MSRRTLAAALAVLAAAAGVVALAIPACSPGPTHDDIPAPPRDDEPPPGPPRYADVTKAAGIDFTYRNGEDAGNFAIIESLGGGVALFDFDRDGRLDVFFPGGGRYEGKAVLGHPCRLYRNLGGWKFEDVSAKVGLAGPFQYGHGAAAFDYDNDGWPDLLLTGYNRLVLLHNEPDGAGRKFVDVTARAGLHDKLWSTSAGWGDLDGDGYPELYVAHYGDWGFDTNHPTDCTYDGKTRDVCQPRRFKQLPHTLYKNNRDGTFTDVSEQLKLRKDGKGIGVLLVDVNGDARPDIYAANDTDDNFLYLNKSPAGGPLALEEVGLAAGVARDDGGIANGSMGVDAGDVDRSGRPSIIVTNYEGELPALYLNRTSGGPPRFTHGTRASGVAVVGGVYVGWGACFVDHDLDGWEDLVMVNGHAIRFPHKLDRRQKPILMRNEGGRFTPITRDGGEYFRAPHNARGLAAGDLDNDGKVDLVVSHLNEPVAVLRNVAPTDGRHWVGVELVGEKNRDVVGARVVVESAGGKQTRFAKGGGSYGTTHDRRQVVGLGADAAVKAVTVYWPSGKVEAFAGVEPDRYHRLVEGTGKAEWVP